MEPKPQRDENFPRVHTVGRGPALDTRSTEGLVGMDPLGLEPTGAPRENLGTEPTRAELSSRLENRTESILTRQAGFESRPENTEETGIRRRGRPRGDWPPERCRTEGRRISRKDQDYRGGDV